jgi:hypothetical protein
MDVFIIKICLDTSVLTNTNIMGRKEYFILYSIVNGTKSCRKTVDGLFNATLREVIGTRRLNIPEERVLN